MNAPEADLTQDKFLGGALSIAQPAAGYRAGVDPVLLAAAVTAHPGQSVLDLGCGAGVASLCLGARVPAVDLAGIEIQPFYANLARRNSETNKIPFEVFEGDLAAPPAEMRARVFDHVIANPPYFQRQNGSRAQDAGREAALAEATPLSVWFDCASRRLRQGGYLTMIQHADRLPDIFAALDHRIGSIELWPIAPRFGREAERVLIRARKSGRAAFRFLPPLVMHEGLHHTEDSQDYMPEIRAVLRDGAGLEWP